jgi:hypothetical protein
MWKKTLGILSVLISSKKSVSVLIYEIIVGN